MKDKGQKPGDRQKLEAAIALQESLRGKVDDAIIDAAITTLREKLASLDINLEFPELQRKQVTIFFADIVNSTHITQHLDPEDTQEIIGNALQKMAQPIGEHGGKVIRFMGDGFLAIFGIPHAHELDPEQAIRAGLGVLETTKRFAIEIERQWNITDFNVRIGINTGLVAVSSSTNEEYTLMGSAVNLAARLETHAPPGGMLISHDTYRHVRGVFDLEALEPVMLKGFDDPILSYRVLRARPRTFRVPSRGVEAVETRMVGRQSELKFLQDAFQSMIEDREGGIITISGEAGLGKSRLLNEFQNWIEFQEDILLFQGRALQEKQQTPFALLHDVFSFRFQIQDSDPLDTVHQKIESGFGEASEMEESGRMRAHFIGHLLGFDFTNSPYLSGVLGNPQQLHGQAIAYLKEYFLELMQQLPVMVFLEDLHWADDNSIQLINHLSPLTSTNPWLIICLSRPMLYTTRPHWGEGLDYHHKLELQALNKKESRSLVAEILQKVDQVPVALRELVVSWAEGNPFYIEELIKMMIENGVIVTGQENWQVIPEKLAQVNVPATLTGVLQARLDSLPDEERMSLRLAAVIGRVFWEEAVNYLHNKLDLHDAAAWKFKVDDVLASLRAHELIFRREGSTFADTNEYIFKHSLLRDVAYESIPKRERRVYHKLSANWLSEITSRTGRLDENAAQIADHYILANESVSAVEWLLRAGMRAKAQDAMREARSYLTRALDLLPADETDRRWQILVDRDEILGILGDREARLAEDDNLVSIAEASGEVDKLAVAYYRKGYFLHTLGQFKDSMQACEKAIEAARQTGNRKLEILALGIIMINHSSLGEIPAATEKADLIMALADEQSDEKILVTTFMNLAGVYMKEDIQKAIQLFERSVEISDRLGNHYFKASGLLNIGYSYTMAGQADRGISALIQALEINKSIGNPRNTIYSLLNLGLAYFRRADYQAALDTLAQAAAGITDVQDPLADAACHVYCGLVYEHMEKLDDARQNYQGAAEAYSQMGAVSYAQDAAAGIARTALAMHDVDEAKHAAVEIWDYLSSKSAEGMEFPIMAYLTCVQIFQAAKDKRRMLAAIKSGYDELIKQAEKFGDEQWRNTYLQAISEHKVMLEIWMNNKDLIQQ